MANALKSGSASSDDESRSIIFEGANTTQLAAMFKMDNRTVTTKIFKSGVKPCKQIPHPKAPGRFIDLYALHEIAPHLVKPILDVEAYIRGMNHHDLPKNLTKEFWAGQRSRQDWEERAGLLWQTSKVVSEVGELMKLFKMSVLLLNDAAERQTELTDRQKEIIRSLSHGLLNDLVKRIEEKFKVPDVKHQEAEPDEEL